MWPFSSPYPDVSCQSLAKEYDYIIIGGGTAGCVLANRLSSDPSVTVLLVERGVAEDTWAARVPLFSTDFESVGDRTFRRNSLPQKFIGGKTQELLNGNVLGGTSRINSMLYTRGNAAEFNAWSAAGRKGWSYDEVLPLFKKSQRSLVPNPDPEAGLNGEWTTRTHDKHYFESTTRVYEAGKTLGFPIIDDVNSSSSPSYGLAKSHFTLSEKGFRQSTFAAFLPAKLVQSRRSRLAVCTGTLTTKIDIKPGPDGVPRAEGVHLQPTKARTPTVHVAAKREVILCSGPLSNPQILQLSGIGPRKHLESLGIPVMKDLPGVGEHLQDHIAVPVVYSVPLGDSLVGLEKRPLTFLKEFAKYMFFGTGLLLSPVLGLSVFARSDLLDEQSHMQATRSQLDARDPENLPDIEIMPTAYDGTGLPFDKSQGKFSFLTVPLRPESTGSIRIASSDPADPVSADLGTLATPHDWHVLRTGLRLSMALGEQMKAAGYAMTDYRVPASAADADLDAFVVKWGRTTYHYASTCRMAPERGDGDGAAAAPGVVDDELRVHGVRGLRVADSSVFPQILATHLQAPTVMVAEKCAELVKASR